MRYTRQHDLVHVHLANIQADVAVFWARLLRRPIYVKVACGGSAGEVRRLAKMAWVTRWFGLRHATRVQALSREIYNELLSIGVDQARVAQIPNGVDLEAFAPVSPDAQRALRRRLELPPDHSIALYVGRFATYKGVLDLLEAWNQIARDGTLLLLVGTAEKTHYSIGPIKPGPFLEVRGWTDKVADYMRAADIFVHPTHADGMANTVLEALACGLPLLATRLGATDELLQEGNDALLVEPHDPQSLADGIQRLMADGDLRSRLRTHAAQTAHSYSIATVVSRIEHEYGAITAARQLRKPPVPA
jgi:glycosyltransferase involved in cell wall biosynthesis